jgi:hypothetical protein
MPRRKIQVLCESSIVRNGALRTGDEEEIVLRIRHGEKHSELKISSGANQVHVGYWWEYFGESCLVISSTIGILAKGEEWPEQAIRKEQK